MFENSRAISGGIRKEIILTLFRSLRNAGFQVLNQSVSISKASNSSKQKSACPTFYLTLAPANNELISSSLATRAVFGSVRNPMEYES